MQKPLKFYKRVKAPDGYPGKTYNNGNCLLHHLVWWQHTGQLVPKGYVLHHKNEDKFDNRFENLELLSNQAHCKAHGAAREKLADLTCPNCGQVFQLKASKARSRQKKNMDGKICCSDACGFQHRVTRKVGRKADGELRHGAAVTYSFHGCRCAICKFEHARRRREYNARKRGAQV